jgi:hypothetical protein
MVANAAGVHSVALPDGVQLSKSPTAQPIVDGDGDVYFEGTSAVGGMPHTWRWTPTSKSVAEMPGVGRPETGADTDLCAADRGQLVWRNEIDSPAGGIYVTELSTGSSWQLTDNSAVGFGTLIGLDAKNLYGVASTLVYDLVDPPVVPPTCPCTPLTVYGVARDGCGTPFVAYETADSLRDEPIFTRMIRVCIGVALTCALGLYHAALVSGATCRAPLGAIPLAGVGIGRGPSRWMGATCTWAAGGPFAPTPYLRGYSEIARARTRNRTVMRASTTRVQVIPRGMLGLAHCKRGRGSGRGAFQIDFCAGAEPGRVRQRRRPRLRARRRLRRIGDERCRGLPRRRAGASRSRIQARRWAEVPCGQSQSASSTSSAPLGSAIE